MWQYTAPAVEAPEAAVPKVTAPGSSCGPFSGDARAFAGAGSELHQLTGALWFCLTASLPPAALGELEKEVLER